MAGARTLSLRVTRAALPGLIGAALSAAVLVPYAAGEVREGDGAAGMRDAAASGAIADTASAAAQPVLGEAQGSAAGGTLLLERIDFADPARCTPNGALSQVLAGVQGDAGAQHGTLAPATGGTVVHTLQPRPRLDWHGLTVAAIAAGESVGAGPRTISLEFAEPALVAFGVLKRLGFGVEAIGAPRRFDAGGTVASMMLATAADGQGSRLTCTFG